MEIPGRRIGWRHAGVRIRALCSGMLLREYQQKLEENTISPRVWGVLALLLAAQSKTSPFNPSGLDLKSCFCLMRGSMDEEERLEFSWECRDEQPWWEPGGRNSGSTGSLPLPAWWCSPQQQLEAPAEILEPPGLP